MADLNKIIDELSTLTVVEAAELSKQLEEKWGVTAAAPVAAAPAGGAAAPAGEEKSEFSIFLSSAGDKKINVIIEAKKRNNNYWEVLTDNGREKTNINVIDWIVEAAPKEVKGGVAKKDAEEFKKKLEAAGAKVELK